MLASVHVWEWGLAWALLASPQALDLDLARLGQTRLDEKSDKAPTVPKALARARVCLLFPVSMNLARLLALVRPHGGHA